MDAEQLRAVQAPLKDRYRADAATARITLHAQGELGSEEISCSVLTGRATVKAGLHPASGGDGSLACSVDMNVEITFGPDHAGEVFGQPARLRTRHRRQHRRPWRCAGRH